MPDQPIYLDFNATTPVADDVLAAMLPWFSEQFGNASSIHAHGQQAADAVHRARAVIAETLSVPSNGLVFTSGATEANNLAIRGVSGRVVVPATEHKAVLDTAQSLDHSIVPVDQQGNLDLAQLDRAAVGAGLISVMLANNETGVVHDLEAVVEIAHRHGCLVHSDATQAFGKMDVDLVALGVDLASVSAHKAYGPKGVGVLYVRRGVMIDSVMTGGGHERGIRSGTLNVPAIVGFGVAAERVRPRTEADRCRNLLDRFVEILGRAGQVTTYSDHHKGLPNTLNMRLPGADAEAVIANSPGICISTGSACTAAIPEPSHVLVAMGVPPEHAFESVRISVGEPTTVTDVESGARMLADAAGRVRSLVGANAWERTST